jgi:coenzyme F420 hydrogenase subunit beta
MTVQRVFDDGLCTHCGTCAGMCPRGSISLKWDLRVGLVLRVDPATCDECGTCEDVCPGRGFDYSEDAWWRERNAGAPSADFLGPWRGMWFGWAADEETRFRGASGGVATAVLQAALEEGLVDTVLAASMDTLNPMAAVPIVARTPDEVAACRGSKYTPVAMNVLLRRVVEEPGRYALIGLPCHLQGLRLAQLRHPLVRERVVLAVGIFCGLTLRPRGTELAARRAGVDPEDLAGVSYRGPDWPGVLSLTTRSGSDREVAYPDYFDRYVDVWVPPRCRWCPDALAELADVSVGDAWLDRFAGTAGVSDIIARTPQGERFIARLAADVVVLEEAAPGEMVRSQREALKVKRNEFRGRLWLRSLTGRPMPEFPGLPRRPSVFDRVLAIRGVLVERLFRLLSDLRY